MSLRVKFSKNACNLFKKIAKVLQLQFLPLFFNKKLIFISLDRWEIYRQSYEPKIADLLVKNLKLKDVFFDVGSHYGLWSLYSAKIVGDKGKVVAFEPSPAFQILKKNINSHDNCNAYNYGVSNTNGKMNFFAQGESTSCSFIKDISKINQHKRPGVPIVELEVDTITLDKFCNEHNLIPDLIKIDVEGHEFRVLEGAKNIISLNSPKLIIELHPYQLKYEGANDKQLLNYLIESNYSYKIVDRNENTLYTIFAQKIN